LVYRSVLEPFIAHCGDTSKPNLRCALAHSTEIPDGTVYSMRRFKHDERERGRETDGTGFKKGLQSLLYPSVPLRPLLSVVMHRLLW